MKIRLYENLRTVSYAPFYLAEALGLFAQQGLEVKMVASPAPEETAAGLLAGRVDVSWGGPMRVMLAHDCDPACPLTCFCQVVARDPFVLVGHRPNAAFRFVDLLGLKVGVVSEVPTPWMTLSDDLQRAGIDPQALLRSPPRSMAENVQALCDGTVDVVQLMEPHVTLALADPHCHVWHEFAVRGPIAFTSFYATRAFIEAHPEVCRALTSSMREAVRCTYDLSSGEVAERIGARFPALAPEQLGAAVARYQRAGLWSLDPSLPVRDVVRLKSALLSGGLIRRDIPYEAFVEDAFAR